MNPSMTYCLLFLLFSVAMIGWCFLHLAAAFWALGRLRDGPQPEIDMNFVRIRDYHAREVREGRVPSATLESPLPASSEATTLPWLCNSDCVLQKGARATAIVSTGALTLEDSVNVQQFADSQGEMNISAGCRIGGPATSATAIRIGRGVSARSISAPEISTTKPAAAEHIPAARTDPLPFPGPDAHAATEAASKPRLRQVSVDTWLFEGDLHPSDPLKVTCRLIVLGSLFAPAGSVFESDVKATGDMILGPSCTCYGAIVSDRNIELGEGTQFQGIVYAAGELMMKTGVRGEGPAEVVAYAQTRVLLDSNILIRGRIASEGSVVSL